MDRIISFSLHILYKQKILYATGTGKFAMVRCQNVKTEDFEELTFLLSL